jgi:tRNA(Ile)-lysidine synthase
LLQLYARWQTISPAPRIAVLTVDHGLRPEATAEAEGVVEAAGRLGFPAFILRWTGVKPSTGLQEAAREARYRLLCEAAIAHGLQAIITAHTEDDQAETLLMRLARGSGLDGLAGMPEATGLGGIALIRPLLGTPKSRLIATLEAAAVPFATDPSNADPRFERSRIRAAGPALGELGITASGLARSSRRLERARQALDTVTSDWAKTTVAVDRLGVATVDLDLLAGAPGEIVVRLVQRLVAATGGTPAGLAKIEVLASWLVEAREGGRTLARAEVRISAAPNGDRRAIFLREARRAALPVVRLAPGAIGLWDGRFRVAVDAAVEAVEIGPLEGAAVEERPGGIESRALGADAAPGARRGRSLVASVLDPKAARQAGLTFDFVGFSTIFGQVRVAKPKNKPKVGQ